MHKVITKNTLSDKSFDDTLEFFAKNVHEQWVAGRIAGGWKYGQQRNDERKEHPGLIPYEELVEEEKEYDRQTVIATILGLLESGYDITK